MHISNTTNKKKKLTTKGVCPYLKHAEYEMRIHRDTPATLKITTNHESLRFETSGLNLQSSSVSPLINKYHLLNKHIFYRRAMVDRYTLLRVAAVEGLNTRETEREYA